MSERDPRERQRAWEAFIAGVDRDWEPWPPGDPDGPPQRLRVLWEFGDDLTDQDMWNAGYVRKESPPTTPDRPARGPGRPGWTPEVFWERYDAAYASAPDPKTQKAIADLFVALDGTVGIDPDYLRQLRRDPRLQR